MKPAPFEYQMPDSLSSALATMANYGDEAKLLAGGQSLVPAMNFRLVQPTLLVDLNGLGELDYVHRAEDGGLRIGAMTRQRRLEHDPTVAEAAPLLSETLPYVAHSQIRNRGTIGGSLAHADPAAELPVIMVALDARIRVRNAGGERWIEAKRFFQGLFATDLAPEEILVEIALPPMTSGTGVSFVELSRRKGDYALLGVAAVLSLDRGGICQRARLVYLNAGDGPVDAREAAALLVSEKLSPALFQAAAEVAVQKEISPSGDIHASVPYLNNLARVLTVRALTSAFQRAKSLAQS